MTDQLFEFAHTTLSQDLGVGFKVDIDTKGGHQSAFATYIGKLGTRVYVPVWIIEPTKTPEGAALT